VAASEEIGFIGVGTIGGPMARRLLERGHALVVHDVRSEALGPLEEAGARTAASPREVAERCRVVLTSLPGPAEVESVVGGEAGILAGAERGDVHVDLSTSSWAMVRRLAALEARAGVELLDAPVSGGVVGAAQGTLTVMASGSRAAFDRVEELLRSLGKHVFHLGESGTGTLAKLANNAIFLCAGLVAQEVFVLAARAGLDPARLLEVLRTDARDGGRAPDLPPGARPGARVQGLLRDAARRRGGGRPRGPEARRVILRVRGGGACPTPSSNATAT